MASAACAIRDDALLGSVPRISFSHNHGRVTRVAMETLRLFVRSVEEKDRAEIKGIFGDPEVMTKFGQGVPFSSELCDEGVSRWLLRWSEGNPFSTFSVFDKSEFVPAKEGTVEGPLIGVVILTPRESSCAEVGYLFARRVWKHGFGFEAVDAVVNTLIPALLQEPDVRTTHSILRLCATARIDNIASQHILTKAGFKQGEPVLKWGVARVPFIKELDGRGVPAEEAFRVRTGPWVPELA